MLGIGIQYLTGYAVATDPTSRDQAEWPPHPARVHMALAAAWFESDRDPKERAVLERLETLGEPQICLPRDEAAPRSTVTIYVPIRDVGSSKARRSPSIQSAPWLVRERKPRTMPRVRVGDAPVHLCWLGADLTDGELDALDALCRRVTRIGHSSSLVSMWVDRSPPPATLVPRAGLARWRLRTVDPGLLTRLEREGERAPSARPRISRWTGYALPETATRPSRVATTFSPDMIVLAAANPRRLDVASTLLACRAMRGTLLSLAPEHPAWLTGHADDGGPDRSTRGHLAITPLPFVGHPHADGRLLGLALVPPADVPDDELARVLGPALFDPDTGGPRRLRLTMGRAGVWEVERAADLLERSRSLEPETWGGGGATPMRRWTSVTPVVLDRFPKQNRRRDPQGWRSEVADMLVESCTHVGLPEPVDVDIDTTAWLHGVPRALQKRRARRDRGSRPGPLGDGFPRFQPRSDAAARPQVHVHLRFAQPVMGPILLGAGRHFGYGLLRPLGSTQRRRPR